MFAWVESGIYTVCDWIALEGIWLCALIQKNIWMTVIGLLFRHVSQKCTKSFVVALVPFLSLLETVLFQLSRDSTTDEVSKNWTIGRASCSDRNADKMTRVLTNQATDKLLGLPVNALTTSKR